MNQYYDPGPERAKKVDQLFSLIAEKYDLINDLQSFGLHRFWKKRLVGLARVSEGEKILDLCCGTGDIAETFTRTGAIVFGMDFNRPMLSVARKRARRKTPDSMHYSCGDALNLPFAEESFNVVAVGYGLRNLADIDRGLSEIRRVTRPGGKILILEFGKPENRILREIYFSYLKIFVPLFGKLFFGNADFYSYILESLNNYPGQRSVDEKLRLLGCKTTRIHNILGGMMSINIAVRSQQRGDQPL